MSVAAVISPCSFLMFDSIRVMRARSTSTKIYIDVSAAHVHTFRQPYLALSYCAQSLNDRQLGLEVRCVVQKAHDRLDHLGGGLFELSMLLR
jgi:hypothetical protein